MTINPFLDWLPGVIQDEIVIDSTNITAEARGNLWAFSLSLILAESLKTEQLESFVRAVVEARSRQLCACGWTMHFYCWYDDQAIQLRFSLVSTSHDHLPFARSVAHSATPEPILHSFLRSPYHDGIPLVSDHEVATSQDTPMPVWVVRLPTTEER